ncbi:MAG: DUF1707 SHOCT-like domain-containing protein [Candidatus Dormibacteria bacterium]
MAELARPDGPSEVRASDSDREAVVDELRQHRAEGRLTLEELEERAGTAYQARTVGELAQVLHDLPQPPPPAPPPPTLGQRLRPGLGYGISAVVLSAVVAAGVAVGVFGHWHLFPLPVLFIGLFWVRRRHWGGPRGGRGGGLGHRSGGGWGG